jgi:hypothetical protein
MSTIDVGRIQRNLGKLIALNEYCYPYASDTIISVFSHMAATDEKDNGLGPFGDILFAALSDLADLVDMETAVITAFLGGLVASYKVPPSPVRLLQAFGRIFDRHTATSQQINEDLAAIAADVSGNLARSFDVPAGLLPYRFADRTTITVADLAEVELPDVNTQPFIDAGSAYVRGFRRGLTKQQLPLLCGYAIGGVFIRHMHAYNTFIATLPPGGTGGVWSADATFVINNQELQLADRSVSVSGSSFDDWNSCAGAFCSQSGALIVVTGRTASSISYKKYYMLRGFYDGERNRGWSLGSADFYAWLFQDDGFGHVTNANGVARREDVFRRWIQNGGLIPPQGYYESTSCCNCCMSMLSFLCCCPT